MPRFKEAAKHPLLEKTDVDNRIPFKAIYIKTKERAQSVPTPCTSYALFYNGEWLTNEQFNDKKFLKWYRENRKIGICGGRKYAKV